MNSDLPQEAPLFFIGLCILGGLFLMSLIRIFLLSRSNSRMRVQSAKMTRQAALQQLEVTGIHHDAMSWRAKTQRQFDALRSDLSHQLQQADQSSRHALKELRETHQKEWSAARAQISQLEAALAAATSPAAPASIAASRVQALEAEIAAAKTETAMCKQQNVMLQRALRLARCRQPATTMRKSPARKSLRSA